MQIYNTMTRRKEQLVPQRDNRIGIYICGPTVYNLIHLGNARPMVVFDALRRYLEWLGYVVDYVTNFTDVDDKIIKASLGEGIEASRVSERYIAEVMRDAEGLNCLPATVYPKVTEEMPDIIAMIGDIINKGFGYAVDGTVFFDTAAKPDYGKLSGRNLSELEAGSRVEVDGRKKNPADFVLWKPAKDGEPSWDSPWGLGRPGWHIECSCMIRKYLGETIDIHTGGADLIFPHHENEVAQSEAANGVPLARYWMHNGLINFDGEKMSKSEGNFFLVRELADRYGYDSIRFYILSIHYRSPVSYAPEYIQAAKTGLARIRNCVRALREAAGNTAGTGVLPIEAVEGYKRQFYAELDDDFNTANAISVIFELVKYANAAMENTMSADSAQGFLSALTELTGMLGFTLEEESGVDDEAVMAIITERDAARAAKDWKRSDELRDKLLAMGVVVKDTAAGTKWHYNNGH